MGHLVELPTKRAAPRPVDPGHNAAILFFTGVRYYRMEEAAVPAAPRRPCAATLPKPVEPPVAELQA